MGSFSAFHWAIVLAIVLLVFGTGKLRSIGSDLGSAIKEFKKNVGEESSPDIRTGTPDQLGTPSSTASAQANVQKDSP